MTIDHRGTTGMTRAAFLILASLASTTMHCRRVYCWSSSPYCLYGDGSIESVRSLELRNDKCRMAVGGFYGQASPRPSTEGETETTDDDEAGRITLQLLIFDATDATAAAVDYEGRSRSTPGEEGRQKRNVSFDGDSSDAFKFGDEKKEEEGEEEEEEEKEEVEEEKEEEEPFHMVCMTVCKPTWTVLADIRGDVITRTVEAADPIVCRLACEEAGGCSSADWHPRWSRCDLAWGSRVRTVAAKNVTHFVIDRSVQTSPGCIENDTKLRLRFLRADLKDDLTNASVIKDESKDEETEEPWASYFMICFGVAVTIMFIIGCYRRSKPIYEESEEENSD